MRIEVKYRSLKVPKNSYADIMGDGLPSYIKRRQKNYLKALGVIAEDKLRMEAKDLSTTGTLERSFKHQVFTNLVRIYSDLNYSNIAMETGRAGGKMPPVQAIRIWAKKRGLGEQAGWAIAKKIAKEGTNLYMKKSPKKVTITVDYMDKQLLKLAKKYLLD